MESENEPPSTGGVDPYVAADTSMTELSVKAVLLGLVLNVVLMAANAYLGLRAGLTISASIPAAVISMGLFYGLSRIGIQGTILENNIVQTMTSAGSSLTAGVIFSLAGVAFLGESIDIVTTAAVSLLGGILGVLFMIPMRRYLIVEQHQELPYPEGTACADVLQAGEHGGRGVRFVSIGFIVGALYTALANIWGVIQTTIQGAFSVTNTRGFALGGDFTPALVGVGYIIGPRIAAYILGGGLVSWMMLIPLLVTGGMVPPDAAGGTLFEQANAVWSSYVRYVGAGAMIVGGLYAIASMRSTILDAIRLAGAEFSEGLNGNMDRKRTARDLPMAIVVVGAAIVAILLVVIPQVRVGLLGALIAVLAAFLFVAVSSYLVGVVGSSSNPVSGMTVATILIAAVVLRSTGVSDPVIVLVTGSVVAIAAAVAGDTSQDLKTGYLLGATPRKQQIAQLVGIGLSALFAGGIIVFFNQAYGLGSQTLPAPQAGLMALIAESVLNGTANWGMVLIGATFAAVLIMMDVPVLPFAVGMYLPISLATPIFLGGVLKAIVTRYVERTGDEEATERATLNGRIVAAGLIAGEAIMGIVVGAIRILGVGSGGEIPFPVGIGDQLSLWLGVAAVGGLLAFIAASTIRGARETDDVEELY
ncbi:OPT family oligopeptide transporter [Halococcus thailandensis]|uniref:Oligopeptide transporter OPT family protein n=1 Tax=Halococcus thailandensis JCM 13552 TaxID=1227457 RepID=M0MWM9_9EURY|nr:oligopeptide transporter, OPT family [Halococcus thailandensis]EMA49723.1 oligopeptide transporter OPT family protein [Halococcus thailandensis JCM 13552]